MAGAGGERAALQRQGAAGVGPRRALAIDDDQPPAVGAHAHRVGVPAGRDEADDSARRRFVVVIIVVAVFPPRRAGILERDDGDRIEAAEGHEERALVRREGQPVRIGALQPLAIGQQGGRRGDRDIGQDLIRRGVDDGDRIAVVGGDVEPAAGAIEHGVVRLAAQLDAAADRQPLPVDP